MQFVSQSLMTENDKLVAFLGNTTLWWLRSNWKALCFRLSFPQSPATSHSQLRGVWPANGCSYTVVILSS